MTALCQCLLVTLTQTNAKVSTLDKRSSDTAAALKNVRTNISGQSTSTHGLTNGQINGHTDSAGLADGTISGQSGPQIGGASAHVHGAGGYAVSSGQHQHGASATNGTLAVADGTHAHTLPTV
jgi:hypothetical protein